MLISAILIVILRRRYHNFVTSFGKKYESKNIVFLLNIQMCLRSPKRIFKIGHTEAGD
jgi:hypothetical protein